MICGIVCECGPNGEPLACGWPEGHSGPHAWADLPTFVTGRREKCDLGYEHPAHP